MTFIIIFMVLLIERFFDCSHLRQWFWVNEYQQLLLKHIPTKSAVYGLLVALVPFLLVILIIQLLIRHSLYGLPTLIFNFFILIYCLGPRNLWADAFACLNSLLHGDTQTAGEKISMCFEAPMVSGMPYTASMENDSLSSLQEKLLKNIFIAANYRIFAVIFWFVILGPLGAVFYRMVNVMVLEYKPESNSEISMIAYKLQALLDYIPIRIASGLFAMGGHFTNVVACWKHATSMGLNFNKAFITECGMAAISNGELSALNEGALIKSAIALIDRTLVIMLVILAALILII